jgi:hypothetical protein
MTQMDRKKAFPEEEESQTLDHFVMQARSVGQLPRRVSSA